jgi:hypothetical protein
MELKEPKHWCFVVAVIGGTILLIFSITNIYLSLINIHQNLIHLLSSFLITAASGGAIYISYSKIKQERYFIVSLLVSILCFFLGFMAMVNIAYDLFFIMPSILEGFAIFIASLTAMFISYVKLKVKQESYFITTLISGFFCLIIGIIILVSPVFDYTQLTPLFLNLCFLFASITIIYVPTTKFRLGIIQLPWRE